MKTVYRNTLWLAALSASFTISSCRFTCVKGSGKQASETRKIDNFSQLSLAGSYKVIIRQDTAVSLKITGDDNLLQDVRSDVSSNRLIIKTGNNVCPSGDFVINIGVKDLTYVNTSGTVDLSADGKIITKDIMFDLSGSTKLNLDINAANVETTGSGLTDITLRGQSGTHKMHLSGSAQVDALNFVVSKYRIESSGAGSYKINVLNDLSVNTSGAADIEYRGNPASISNNKSGIGTLKKID